MTLLILFIAFYIALSVSLYFLFEKIGEAGWQGLVPGLNFVVWSRLVGRSGWWAAWLLFPIVNIFIFAGLAINMVRSFGKYGFWHSVAAVIFTPIFFFLLARDEKEKYLGPAIKLEKDFHEKLEKARAEKNNRLVRKLEANNPYHKSSSREWAEAIIFAVFAAAFIRMFLIEAYVIPTSSMEGSLLVGDFLFVSKAHYGIRTPKTVAMVPLLHNRIPGLNTESYLENPNLPFYRLPAIESIDRNDPVVFNYPEGDSVYVFPTRTWSIHDYRRNAIGDPMHMQRIKSGRADLITRPVDKMDHYIKRCVAIPGDTLEIRDRQLYINGAPAENPQYLQYMYLVRFPAGTPINTNSFSDWGISREDVIEQGDGYLALVLSNEQKEKIQAIDPNVTIEVAKIGEMERNPDKVFPHDPDNFQWTVDDFGPLYVPQKGRTIRLTPETIAPYKRIIAVYEDNDLAIRNGKIFINDEETSEYTFQMDYYWMMGDNRHNSEDSRIWGFVPQNHIVGKPLFIWFSTKEGSIGNGIRWNRIFTSADKR